MSFISLSTWLKYLGWVGNWYYSRLGAGGPCDLYNSLVRKIEIGFGLRTSNFRTIVNSNSI